MHLPPPSGLIIGGSRVEHDTPRNGPVAAGRIASESQNLNGFQPGPSAQTRVAKSQKIRLLKKKIMAIISYLQEAAAVKSSL